MTAKSEKMSQLGDIHVNHTRIGKMIDAKVTLNLICPSTPPVSSRGKRRNSMCEMLSWIEKKTGTKTKIYFLTGRQIFETEKGREFREWCKSPDDYTGHGAIRHFYGLEQDEGTNEECTDFSTPANFPKAIVSALKAGDYRGFPIPQKILSKPLNDKYQADWKTLNDKYKADWKPLNDKYKADWKPLNDKYQADWKTLNDKYKADWKPLYDKYKADRKTLYDKYQADWKTLNDKYKADWKPLYDKYKADRKTLYDKYQADWKTLNDKYQADLKPLYDKYKADWKTLYDKYWDLFTVSENRAEAWR
jgi:hypothetical protein